MLNENVSTGGARRARFGGIKQRVGSSEVISNKDVANAAQKSNDAKKSAGDAAHAAATKAGKSPMEAETARNRAHREYEKAQKKARLKENHIDVALGKELDDEGSMILNQLDQLEMHVKRMREVVTGPDMQVPAWVQSKITLATDYMDSVANYMSSKNEETDLITFSKFTEGAAWTKKEGQNSEGGLNEKGRKSYERENPGSDLKAPSKKVGNPRRASFCARMKGMKAKLTSKKTANDPDSRINKSLRAWNC